MEPLTMEQKPSKESPYRSHVFSGVGVNFAGHLCVYARISMGNCLHHLTREALLDERFPSHQAGEEDKQHI